METAKLTLRPTKEVIDLAREMAKEDNTSITQMFSSFILSRSKRKKKEAEIPVGPLTQSLTGIVRYSVSEMRITILSMPALMICRLHIEQDIASASRALVFASRPTR